MLLAKAFGIWLLILLCAVLNGMLREALLLPTFGKPAAFVISGVVLSLLIVAVSLVLVPHLGPLSISHAMYVGVFWLALTLAFEFGLGLFVQHRTWAELMEAYTFRDGNIWPLVLAVTLFSPTLAVRLRPGAGGKTGTD
jgi:hypothetical protein